MGYRTLLVLIALLPFLAGPVHAQAAAEGLPDPAVRVGDFAPDFTLKDQNLKDVSLAEFREKKNVILAFYVFAFTSG